jgi:diguanylate cyclase (GGDEF)-like protein/PAS domain S-box-containing protein
MNDLARTSHLDHWYQVLFLGNPLPMVICDPKSLALLDVNASALAHFGLAHEEWPDMRITDLHPAEETDKFRLALDTMHEPQPHDLGTWRLQKKDGTELCVELHRYRIPFAGSLAMLIMVHDVGAHMDMQAALRKAQRDLNQAQELGRIGTWVWNAKTDSHDSSSCEAFRIFGLTREDTPLKTTDLFKRIHPEDRAAIMQARMRALSDPSARYDVQFRIFHPNGNLRHLRSMAEVRFDERGRPLDMIGLVQDITEQKQAEENIRRLAYYDDITGLPNRNLFRQTIGERLAPTSSGQYGNAAPTALLIIDLVGFRDINYTLGHVNGNLLLCGVGVRIKALLREGDMVARVGSRFVIMLGDAGKEVAEAQAHKIITALEDPFPIAGTAYEIFAHVGIALAPVHGMDTDTLLRKADVALYQAAQAGQSVSIYNATQDPYTPQRLALIGEFRKAIETGQLKLYCQPKINIRTGELVGAEALVRWAHPKLGFIPPDEFIPLIETTELIHVLTQFMLETSVEQCRAWRSSGVSIPLAVNLSPRNLAVPHLSEDLARLLSTRGAQAEWLELEITESSLMQNPATSIAELNRLSEMGFRLFIDDFGTGYSSLSYLTRLPVNVIKIDHGFTMEMITDRGAAAIVKSTIDLAHDLGMLVVAEGTADQQIWNALSALGCDEAQGYFISPPIPAQDLMDWIRSSRYSLPSTTSPGLH